MDRLEVLNHSLTVLAWYFFIAASILALGIEIGWQLRKRCEPSPKKDDSLRLPLPPSVPSFAQETHRPSHPSDDQEAGRQSTIPPDEEINIRDRAPIEQLELSGYRCEELEDEDEFDRTMAGEFNFAATDDETRYCEVCSTEYLPYAVWGTSSTREDGLIGYFCGGCGCGFLVSYRLGEVKREPTTVFKLLRPEPATVIQLAQPDN